MIYQTLLLLSLAASTSALPITSQGDASSKTDDHDPSSLHLPGYSRAPGLFSSPTVGGAAAFPLPPSTGHGLEDHHISTLNGPVMESIANTDDGIGVVKAIAARKEATQSHHEPDDEDKSKESRTKRDAELLGGNMAFRLPPVLSGPGLAVPPSRFMLGGHVMESLAPPPGGWKPIASVDKSIKGQQAGNTQSPKEEKHTRYESDGEHNSKESRSNRDHEWIPWLGPVEHGVNTIQYD